MFMICVHAKFQVPSSNGPLVTDIKLKAREHFHIPRMLLLYILQKYFYNKSCIICMYFCMLFESSSGQWHDNNVTTCTSIIDTSVSEF